MNKLYINNIRETITNVLIPYGINKISIFGSIVRGDDRPESDIDILIKLKPPQERQPIGFFKWIELEDELSRKLGRKVDLISDDGVSPYIRPYIEKEEVVLYEKR